jgi:hypothetical protein
MPLHPRMPKDLMLAPVAAAVDQNLQHLRDRTPAEIDDALAVELNIDPTGSTADRRRAWILEQALRFAELHDWTAEITADDARLRLSGGSVTLDLGLSASISRYIADGR